ncbi:unnamed protein product [Onchocerca ochengi]|uniref:Uncharacterized protein n=1 Tax=Onchocerca ochengi TaxID=42157 RepID=A0A182E4W2_ONCOC|nr:unnamed protein product [Onchocerca ochengi]
MSKKAKLVIAFCKPIASCYDDSDIPAGKCLGIAVGTCNCAACMQFAQCKLDMDCGDLKGFKCAGFKSIVNAMTKICKSEGM